MLDELLKRDFVFTDNSNGWFLLKKGLKPGQKPDIMNITAPDIVGDLQRKAVEAGSDIVFTNTFGTNAKTLRGTGYTVRELVGAAVAVTKKACAGRALTALDVGPIGEFIKPFGPLSFDESYELYREQATAAEEAGADLVAVETMSDLYEVKAVMRAVRENTRLPLFVMMTFDRSGRTFTGCRPESFAVTAEALGAKAIGINCSLAPAEIYPIAEKLIKSTSLPVIVKPNAGLPNSAGEYEIGPEEFARQMAPFASLGVKIVGGCCGTTSVYQRAQKSVSSFKAGPLRADLNPRICAWLRIESVEGLAYDPSMKTGASEEEIIENAVSSPTEAKKSSRFSCRNLSTKRRRGSTQRTKPVRQAAASCFDNLQTLSAALHHVTGTPAISSPSGDKNSLQVIASKYGAVVV